MLNCLNVVPWLNDAMMDVEQNAFFPGRCEETLGIVMNGWSCVSLANLHPPLR
jgi:hypothetical protein